MPRQKKQKLIGLGLPANLLKEFIQLSYKGNTSIHPEGYSIDAPLSDSRVKVYTKNGSNDKEVIIVHRGSVGAQDWIDNAKFFVAGKVKGTKSYELHKERQLKAVEKYGGENIIGLGHSRAGLYLQELQKDPSTKLNEIITYNKAVGFYDALRTNPDEQTDVKVKNDFVSLLSGLQKRKNKMVEIEATKNPLDFNKAHQAEEIEKLGETFIGKKDELSEAEKPMTGSGRAPSPKTLEQLKKMQKTLEGKLAKINKGKVYKTTNKEKVEYELSYTKARVANYETKGEDLIITKKKKYGNELPAKAKPYKAKAVKPKEEPKPEPKKEEPKPEPKKEEPKPEPKKEEPKPEPKKEEPKPKPKKEEPKPKKEPQPWSQSGICKKIMCAYGLRNKAQYKAWIVKNHPDKGGTISNEDLIKILECANSKMYCKGKKPVIVEPEPPEPLRLIYKEEPKKEEPKKEEAGSSKDHAKIKIPEPEPTKQKIEPLMNKLEDKIKEFEELGRKHGAVIYDSGTFIQTVAYISLIMQYEAKCAIVGDFKDFSNYEISSDLKSIKNDIFYSKAKEFSEDLLDCIKRGDNLIAIPLSLKLEKDNAGHANMLIYRPFDKTIERIEPHGQTIDGRKLYSKTYNAVLKRMFEEEMKPYLKEYTPKFIPSDQVCPSLRGFQSLESSLAGGAEEGIGFCGMWSLFMLELLFLNPTLPTSEIIKIALNISKNKPQYLKNVIRGYVLRVEKMLDSYIKKIDASDGFKFKTGKKIQKKLTLLQEQLLNLLLSFNSETSKVEKLKETVKFNKQKDIATSAIRKLLLSKTIDELTEMINTIFKIDLRNNKDVDAEEIIIWLINTFLYEDKKNLGSFKRFGSQYKDHYIDDIYNYYNVKKGGIFGWSDEEKEAKKAKQEAKRAEKKAKYDAQKKEQNVKIGELIVSLKALKKKKQAQKEATEAPKAEAEPEAETEAEPIEGGIFGWSDKEKADKAERKMLREEYYKTHNRQQNANYTFDKTARANWKKEFYKKNTFKKADDTMPKAVDTMTGKIDTNEQQAIDEADQEMLGSGMYYLKEISKPTNPIFKYKKTDEIPTFIDPETEFLMGGAFTDMLGMNCNKEDGSCFNPVWERRKIRSQILSEYKIWYNPFAPPAPGTIRMAWLNPMIEERFKPIYDEFVARRNVNVGLPADASRDRFAQQMFSNITDGLSYIPGSNIATAGLTLASTLSDSKKEDGT